MKVVCFTLTCHKRKQQPRNQTFYLLQCYWYNEQQT